MPDESIEFTLHGKIRRMDSKQIVDALKTVTPEPIQKVFVEVGGKRFPIKQAFSVATGVPRSEFTSQEARRPFKRLGFPVNEMNSDNVRPGMGAFNTVLFEVDGEEFETSKGTWTAELLNTPGGQATDRVCFRLRLTEGNSVPRTLELWLSDAGLHHDPLGTYKLTAYQLIRGWLEGEDPTGKLYYFG